MSDAIRQIADAVLRLIKERHAIARERDAVVAAVREHHDQRGDDRCYLDDLKLYYAVLGEGVDPYACALPPEEDMDESCRRFRAQRRCPGPRGVVPLPFGMTISQLTAEVERLRAERDAITRLCYRHVTTKLDSQDYYRVILESFDRNVAQKNYDTEAEVIAAIYGAAGLEPRP